MAEPCCLTRGKRIVLKEMWKVRILVCCVGLQLLAHPTRALQGRSTCRQSPVLADDEAIENGKSFELTCSFDQELLGCFWSHCYPENDQCGTGSHSSHPDIQCNFAVGNNVNSCPKDQRLKGQSTTNTCGLTVSNSRPEDTGLWMLIYSDVESRSDTHSFIVSTYNATSVALLDEDRNQVRNIDTKYNWNDKQDEYEEGEGGFEQVRLYCLGAGGRPYPEFRWKIENDEIEDDEVFQVTDRQQIRSYGYQGIIKDFESELKFTVDQKFLERLRRVGVDTNPREGGFSFNVDCEVGRDASFGSIEQREVVRVSVRKSYDDGNLKASTIGIIAGVVVAVVVLLAVIALLLFAKASGRWCFADEDYTYRNPKDPRNAPNSAGGGDRSGGGGSSNPRQHQGRAR